MTKKLYSSSEERRHYEWERALVLLDRPLVRHFMNALDVLGWKVVRQEDPSGDNKWPFPYCSKGKWPSWCENELGKPSPKLRLIDGGKPPDDGGDDGGGGSR
jgi:hypothetical protein